MKHFRHWLTAAALFALIPPVQAQHSSGSNLPALTAPTQASQFDFLIGHWEVELTPKVSGLAAAIHGAPRLLGTWKAWRAFDGFGVDDELRIMDAGGNPVSLSHNMRIFDPKLQRWSISGLDVYRARFSTANARWKDGEMWAEGHGLNGEGRPYQSRTRFFEIGADSFRMQQDRSYDSGENWEEASLTIVAKRVAASASR